MEKNGIRILVTTNLSNKIDKYLLFLKIKLKKIQYKNK